MHLIQKGDSNSKHYSFFVFYFNVSNKISSNLPRLLNFQEFPNPPSPLPRNQSSLKYRMQMIRARPQIKNSTKNNILVPCNPTVFQANLSSRLFIAPPPLTMAEQLPKLSPLFTPTAWHTNKHLLKCMYLFWDSKPKVGKKKKPIIKPECAGQNSY